jgi:hypothetical protein
MHFNNPTTIITNQFNIPKQKHHNPEIHELEKFQFKHKNPLTHEIY